MRPMTKDQALSASRLIVNDIMDNDCGKADRLVMTVDAVDGEPVKDLGGWGRVQLTARITLKLLELRLVK